MESLSVKRRLACILAADAVGYSRMVGAHESETLRVLAAHRAVIDGIIAFHEGRIFSTAGDSVVAEFASAVDGVRCAVEIQSALRTRNESLPEDQRLQFRIGLNLGDVVVKGTDVLGDGVNVAARLESIAEPGGICISSSVYDQITGKLDLGLVDIGDQQLKNIARPIRAFRVHGASMPAVGPARSTVRQPWVWGGGIGAVIAVALIAWWVQRTPGSPAVETKPTLAASAPSPSDVRTGEAQAKLAAELEAAQAARREADLARQQAGAELSRARAEAEASATRNKALSDAAALRASAQADAEKLRAQARQEAATRGAGTAPSPPGAATASTSTAAVAAGAASAPSTASAAPAIASASAPTAASPMAATAGTERWTGTLACNAYEESPSFSRPLPAYRQDGVFVMDWGERGAPGSAHIEGRPEGSGVLVMTGTAIAMAKRFRGRIVDVRFDGRLADGRYELKGSIGVRNCTLALVRA